MYDSINKLSSMLFKCILHFFVISVAFCKSNESDNILQLNECCEDIFGATSDLTNSFDSGVEKDNGKVRMFSSMLYSDETTEKFDLDQEATFNNSLNMMKVTQNLVQKCSISMPNLYRLTYNIDEESATDV